LDEIEGGNNATPLLGNTWGEDNDGDVTEKALHVFVVEERRMANNSSTLTLVAEREEDEGRLGCGF
jgi:hypothetical protein